MKRVRSLFAFSKGHGFKDQLKNYLRLVFIYCPLTTVVFIVGFNGPDHLGRQFMVSFVISLTVSSSCYWGSRLVGFCFNSYRRRRELEPKKTGLLWSLLTSYPFLLPGLYFGFELASHLSSATGKTWASPAFTDYSSGIIFGTLISVAFALVEVIRESKEAKQAAELRFGRLENEKLKAQISALTAQMNPHLLFNSLNTIASTIATDPGSAEDMVVRLSDLYRGILKSAKGEMHTLESELQLCVSYLDIERKRFGPRVEYKIFVDEQVDPRKIKIPVLLLQPLVENAVKHGIGPKRDGGLISIDVKRCESYFVVDVIDNGVGLEWPASRSGTGTGLANCASRIKLKYGEGSKFSFARNAQNETTASIHLPLKEVLCD